MFRTTGRLSRVVKSVQKERGNDNSTSCSKSTHVYDSEDDFEADHDDENRERNT